MINNFPTQFYLRDGDRRDVDLASIDKTHRGDTQIIVKFICI